MILEVHDPISYQNARNIDVRVWRLSVMFNDPDCDIGDIFARIALPW